MGLKDLLRRNAEKSERFKQAEEEMKIHNTLEERQKSSNRREFERFLKEKEEENIKGQLEKFREERKKDIASMSILKGKNIFKGHDSILKQKNLFTVKSGNIGGNTMFFN